jgi:hypothetical protein
MADAELGVMLEPTNDLQDEVEDVQADVTGGGDVSPGQRDQQESIVAGGVSKGLLAAGVLGGVLTQLKSVTGIIEGVFGIISRALVPVVEVVADLLRPINQAVQDFITAAGEIAQALGVSEAVESAGQTAQATAAGVESLNRDIFKSEEETIESLEERNEGQGLGILSIDPADQADRTGEGWKTQLRDIIETPFEDTLGGGVM